MKAVIVGGGIGGLTTALTLKHFDIPFELYERERKFAPAGAALWLAPNASRVLDRLGILPEVLEAGFVQDRNQLTDHTMRPLRTWHRGYFEDSYGYPFLCIMRSDLQAILRNALPSKAIRMGHALETMKGEEDPYLTFSGKVSATADIVIGADGQHSKLREILFGPQPLTYSGQTSWRGIAPYQLRDDWQRTTVEAWGDDARFGFAQVAENLTYWFAVAAEPEGGVDRIEGLRTDLLLRFAPFQGPVRELITSTPKESIIRTDLRDMPPLRTWSSGHAVLVGDAAHPMTPNLGQGACQAIEDAWHLAKALHHEGEVKRALQTFQQKRMLRAHHVVKESRRAGKLAHQKRWKGLRNLMVRKLPDRLAKRKMNMILADLP